MEKGCYEVLVDPTSYDLKIKLRGGLTAIPEEQQAFAIEVANAETTISLLYKRAKN